MLREFKLVIRPGVGIHSGSWLWYLDGATGELAQGVETSPAEAAIAGASTLCYMLGVGEMAEECPAAGAGFSTAKGGDD